MEIFDILGAVFPPPVAIVVKFCTAKRTQVPVGPAKFDVNRCNESLLRGENPDFWPVSKFNTGRLPLRGNPAGKNNGLHSIDEQGELPQTDCAPAFLQKIWLRRCPIGPVRGKLCKVSSFAQFNYTAEFGFSSWVHICIGAP